MINENTRRKISADYVVDFLMGEFISKKVKPGDRVIETQISNKMNVSQTVVREAINLLVFKGFLERESFKGAKFKRFTIRDVIDYQEVRARLEVMAVELSKESSFYKNINLEYIQDVIDKMLTCSTGKDYKGRTYYDIQFHKHIVQAADNKSLLIAWKSLGHYYWSYVWLYLNVETLYKRTIDHQGIYEALKSRDRHKLIFLINKHFLDLTILLSKEEKKSVNLVS